MTAPTRRLHRRARPRGPGVVTALVVAAVAAVLAIAAWALAGAPASAPDDNFHLPSIWCAHGVGSDRCEAVPGDPTSRSLPANATVAVTCYVADPLKSASCQDPVIDDATARGVVGFGNWQGVYPPIYYWLAGWFVTGSVTTSILLIRIFTGAVVVAVLAALFWLVPRRLRPVAVVPSLVTSVPLAMSLYGSTNPSAWGITGPAVVWVALHAAYAARDGRQRSLCVLAFVGVLVGAGARADACLFTAMAVVLAFILNTDRLRSQWLPSVTGLLAIGTAGALFLGANQSAALSGGLASEQVIGSASTMSNFELLVSNVGQVSTLWTGFLGTTPIGWLDTPLPSIVWSVSTLAVVAVLLLTWRRVGRRHALALLLSGLSLLVYPLYILGRSHLAVGQGIQPRYLLPLAVVFVGLVLLTGGARLSVRQARLVAAGLAVANAVALHVQVRRYVTGLDVSAWNLDSGREWWWDLPIGPMAVWVVGSVAFAVVAVLVMQLCVARPAEEPTASLV